MLLYYITDRLQFPGDEVTRRRALLDCIAAAANAGVDYIQLREKDLSPRELEALASSAVERLSATGTKLLVNTRIDVAIAVGAHGVHLPSGDSQLPASEVRVIFAKAGIAQPIIAVSCHTRKEVEYAEAHGADFAVFGPVFAKGNTKHPEGLAKLRDACARPSTPSSRMPVLALSGIALDNAQSCLAAGAAGIAAIRLFQDARERLPAVVTALRSIKPSANPQRTHPYGG